MEEEMEANTVALADELWIHDDSQTLLRGLDGACGRRRGGRAPPLPCAGLRRPCSIASASTRRRPGRDCRRRSPGCWRSTGRWSARTARRAGSPGGSTPAWRSATRCWSGPGKSSCPGSPVVALGPAGTGAGCAGQSAPGRPPRELLGSDRYAAHLGALGGRAAIERSLARIERAAVLDHLPAEVVAACEAVDERSPREPAGTASSCRSTG